MSKLIAIMDTIVKVCILVMNSFQANIHVFLVSFTVIVE